MDKIGMENSVDKVKNFFRETDDKSLHDEEGEQGLNILAIKDPFEDSESDEDINRSVVNSDRLDEKIGNQHDIFEKLRRQEFHIPMLDLEEHDHGIVLNKTDRDESQKNNQYDDENLNYSSMNRSEQKSQSQITYGDYNTQKIFTNSSDSKKLNSQTAEELTQGKQFLLKAVFGDNSEESRSERLKTESKNTDDDSTQSLKDKHEVVTQVVDADTQEVLIETQEGVDFRVADFSRQTLSNEYGEYKTRDDNYSRIQDTTGDISGHWTTPHVPSSISQTKKTNKNISKPLVIMSSEYPDEKLGENHVISSPSAKSYNIDGSPQLDRSPREENESMRLIIESPVLQPIEPFPVVELQFEKDELVESSPLKNKLPRKFQKNELSLRRSLTSQESDEPIKTNANGKNGTLRFNIVETDEEFNPDEGGEIDDNLKTQPDVSHQMDNANQTDITELKNLNPNSLDQNSFHEVSKYPSSILRAEKEKKHLTYGDVRFPENVWCFYDTNYTYYPGKICDLKCDEHFNTDKSVGVYFYNSSKPEYMKTSNVKHLDIMIGDLVLLNKIEHEVTGLECRYPKDEKAIRCIRGYDTVYLNPTKGKKRGESAEIFAKITMDVDRWYKKRFKSGEESILDEMEWSSLKKKFGVEESVVSTPSKMYNLRKRTRDSNFYEMSTQVSGSEDKRDGSRIPINYEEEEDDEDEEEAGRDEDSDEEFSDIIEDNSMEVSTCKKSKVAKFLKDPTVSASSLSTARIKNSSPLRRDTTGTYPVLNPPTFGSTSIVHKPTVKVEFPEGHILEYQRERVMLCAAENTNIFQGCLFLFTGLDDELKSSIAEGIVKHGGIYIPNELSSVLKFNSAENRMELDEGLQNEIGEIKFVALISNQYRRSMKYIEMLAMGLPILHYEYLFECFARGALITDFSIWKYLLPAGEVKMFRNEVKSYNILRFYENVLVKKDRSLIFENASIRFQEDYRYSEMNMILVIYGDSKFEKLITFLSEVFKISKIVKIKNSNNMHKKLGELVNHHLKFEFANEEKKEKTRFLIYKDDMSDFEDKNNFCEYIDLMNFKEVHLKSAFVDIIDKEMIIQSIISEDFKVHF